MKTLILNGSPRSNGDTVKLIEELIKHLHGDYKIINAYRSDISPCVDCRYCWKNPGCSINDEMTEIYDYIKTCDNVVIASPIYFSQPTGKLLDVCSRLQAYFALKHFQKQSLTIKPKKGVVLLVGGGDGKPQKAYETLSGILSHINVYDIYRLIGSFNTNINSVAEDKIVLEDICSATDFLNINHNKI